MTVHFGVSRRRLLRQVGVLGGAGIAGLLLAGCDQAVVDELAHRPVRREVSTSAAERDLDSYRRAVERMRALPDSDPRSWVRQADIHAQRCRHASWLFLPWHRAYLWSFERICRELSGDPSFALPYWDWTAHPRLPAPFWDPASALYHGGRVADRSAVADPRVLGPSTIAAMLDEPNFLVFGGAPTTSLDDEVQYGEGYGLVEQGPHNYVHGFVGSTMGTFMSPLDPVFWLHHNRIDQLWVEWNLGRDHPNPAAAAWSDTRFNGFADHTGAPVTTSVWDTVVMPLVDYRFDTQEPRGGPTVERVRAGARTTVDVRREITGVVMRADEAGVVVVFPGSEDRSDEPAQVVFGVRHPTIPPEGAVLVSLADSSVPLGSVAFFTHEGHGPGPTPFRLPLPAPGPASTVGPVVTLRFEPIGYPGRPAAPTMDVIATLVLVQSHVDR